MGPLASEKTDTNEVLIICKLVAFVVSSIMKTEEEWEVWGKPFLRSIFIAQFQEEVGLSLLGELDEHFHPLIGKRSALWIENAEAEDYSIVSFTEQRINAELQSLAIDPSANLDAAVKEFLQRFLTYTTSSQTYDARARQVARRICMLLNMAARDFCELEQHSMATSHCSQAGGFLDSFQTSMAAVPRSSLVTPYRMLKVALVAVGGGAMVGMASVVAAPTIITTVVPLLTTAIDLMQVSVALDTFLGYVGVLAYPIIPGIFGGYGTSVAGYQMLKRTAELSEFSLSPLQNPSVAAPSGERLGGNVTILVSGHVGKDTSYRQVWGADGSSFVADAEPVEETLTSYEPRGLFDKIAEKIVEKTAALGHPLFAAHATVKESEHSDHAAFVESDPPLQTNPIGTSSASESLQHAVSVEAEPASQEAEGWEKLEVNCKRGWWREILHTDEAYLLEWEPALLAKLHDSFLLMLKNQVFGRIYGEIYGQVMALTPIPSIKRSMGLPLTVLKKIEELNDPWVVAMDRARQSGYLLARSLLLQKAKSSTLVRPVCLVGYGMGARVIFHCLEHLHTHGDAAQGIVENAVLMGAPVTSSPKAWREARSVVAGRLINCYSTSDYILALLYRTKSLEFSVAGLAPVTINQPDESVRAVGSTSSKEVKSESEEHPNAEEEAAEERQWDVGDCVVHDVTEVENVDVTTIAKNHSDYPLVLKDILLLLNL